MNTVPSPDAELIGACSAHIVNLRRVGKILASPDYCADPRWLAYEHTRDVISEAAPQTMAGLLAIARAAKAEAQNPDGSEQHENCPASDWAWLITRAMLRLYGGAA